MTLTPPQWVYDTTRAEQDEEQIAMFDPKCHELADYFLNGEAEVTDDEVNKLAQHIQDEIEGWLTSRDPALIAKLAARTTKPPTEKTHGPGH